MLHSTGKNRGAVEAEGTELNRRKMNLHHRVGGGVAGWRGEAVEALEACAHGMLESATPRVPRCACMRHLEKIHQVVSAGGTEI